MIRNLIWAVGIWVGVSVPVLAACVGQNQLDALAGSDPAAHAGIFERAAGIQNGQGRFWRVDGAGAEPSYLFGTFHTAEAVETVTPEVWQALDRARIALFELSLDEQVAMERRISSDPTFAFDPEGPGLSERLDEANLAVLGDALATRGLTLEAAENMRPWLLFTLLGFPACHLQAMATGAEPLDTVMAQRAGDRQVPVLGLETYEQALSAFQRIEAERFLEMMVETGALITQEEDIFRTNTDLYVAGEISAINEYSIWLSEAQGRLANGRALNEEIMVELLDVRNRSWMPAILREVRGGNAFVAVGALHLPDRVGLIELLRAEGLTVTRLD